MAVLHRDEKSTKFCRVEGTTIDCRVEEATMFCWVVGGQYSIGLGERTCYVELKEHDYAL